MKYMLVILLGIAICRSTVESAKSKEKPEEGNTEKRTLVEGNEGVKKRAPVTVTASPSPLAGIEYADVKGEQVDKTPVQQIYATPVPQIAKISDVLTGQAQVAFPAAIAHHLYSPVSIYQQRLGSPTTYEISPPIPSQLAYSEHKIYQPTYQPIQKLPPQNPKSTISRLKHTVNQQPRYPEQQAYIQQQPLLLPQQQSLFAPPSQPLFQYQLHQPNYNQPQSYAPIPQQVPQFNAPNPYLQPQNNNQNIPQYNPNLPPAFLQIFHSIQPGVTFAKQQNPQTPLDTANRQPNYQWDQKASSPLSSQRQSPPQQYYNDKAEGAVSYASFSQSQPNFAQTKYQDQTPIQPSTNVKQEPASANSIQSQKSPSQQMLYIRPEHYIQNLPTYQPVPPQLPLPIQTQQQYFQSGQYPNQPRQYQNQPGQYQNQNGQYQNQLGQYQNQNGQYQNQPEQYQSQPGQFQNNGILVQDPGYPAPQPIPLAPSFAPVQYFGKFAESIFGNFQQ